MPRKSRNLLEARLGVTTCDKCLAEVGKGEQVVVIAEGTIVDAAEMLTFHGACIRYACHLHCWDGVEEPE